MANPYAGFSLRKIIRNCCPSLLEQYLHAHDYLLEHDLEAMLEERGQKKYEQQLELLLEPVLRSHQRLLADIIKIHVLAKPHALMSLIARCKDLPEELRAAISDLKSNYDRALYILIYARKRFIEFFYLYTADIQSGKYWTLRNDYVPEGAEALTADDILRLKGCFSSYLAEQALGNICSIEHIVFDDRDYLFFIAEDVPQIDEEIESGELISRFRKPAFKISIVYDHCHRQVEVCCQYKNIREAVHKAFAKEQFQKDIPDRARNQPIYNPQHVFDTLLEQGRFTIHIPPHSPVKDIWIKAVRLILPMHDGSWLIESNLGRRAKVEGAYDHIYHQLSLALRLDKASANHIRPELTEARWLEFVVDYKDQYEGLDGRKKFTFNGKNQTNLGHSELDRHIRECLIRSGVIRRSQISEEKFMPPALAAV